MSARALPWDGCHNVRDLGGLPTASGGRTRAGVVIRADSIGHLTPRGRERALAAGVRRVVDLRFPGEEGGEPDAQTAVEVVRVSLFGERDAAEEAAFDERVRDADDVAAAFADGYVAALERNRGRVGEAVTAVAEADGPVVVHCLAGKDRTGIVSALLLAAAGVPDGVVAADYALSEPNMLGLFGEWVAASRDEGEHRLRSRLIMAPAAAMAAVLQWLRTSAGGAEEYLRSAGVGDPELRRLRARLAG